MRVRPEVSELSDAGSVKLNGFLVPALTTRRAETTVELGSGQSFMIAGLLQNRNRNNIDKAPFLGDLPILGMLFRSTSYQRDETELVIIVTPYLVRPVSGQLATPADGYRAPTDAQFNVEGQTFTGRSGPAGSGSVGCSRHLRRSGGRNSGIQTVTRRSSGRTPRCVPSSPFWFWPRLPLPAAATRRTTCPIAASPRSTCRSSTSADYVFDASAPGGALAPGEGDAPQRLVPAASTSATATSSMSTAPMPTAPRRRSRGLPAVTGCWSLPALRSPPASSSGQFGPGGRQPHAAPRFRDARTGAFPSQPNYNNRSMSNFGCGVNSNLAAMVANPEDLIHGRESGGIDRRAVRDQGHHLLPDCSADRREGAAGHQHQEEGRVSDERSFPGPGRAARSVHRLRLRRCHRRHAPPGCGRARLVAGEGQQGRPPQRGPVAVGVREPEHPVRGSQRIGRPAERHQRARGSLRAGHDRDRCRHRQRRAPLPRPRRQRHPRLSAQAVHRRSPPRHVRARPDDHLGAARRSGGRQAPRDGRGHRRPRRRRRFDHRDLARLVDG